MPEATSYKEELEGCGGDRGARRTGHVLGFESNTL